MADTERKTYIETILPNKTPLESIELIKLRLNESRAINSSLIEFFEGYLKTQQSYAGKLNQVLLKGSKLFNDNTQFNKELDTLGLFEPIWNSLIGEINTELKLVDIKTKTLNVDVLSKLNNFERKYKGNSENLNNLRKLGYKLQKLSENSNRSQLKQQEFEQLSREWESRVPNFVEIVENYDFNRFILLKDVFLSLQSNNQDTLPELTKLTEKSLEFILNFDPNDEIKRFADEVVSKDIQFDMSDLIVKGENDFERQEGSSDRHHSFLGNSTKHRHASNASMNTFNSNSNSNNNNSLMNDGFTGLNLPISQPKSKEKNKLKSRVGSIFGKKKKDKRGKGSFLPDTIAESPMDYSNNTSRTSLPLSSNPTSTPPPTQQQHHQNNNITSSSQQQQQQQQKEQQFQEPPHVAGLVNRRSSAVSSDLYQTSRAATMPVMGFDPQLPYKEQYHGNDNNNTTNITTTIADQNGSNTKQEQQFLTLSSQPLTPSPNKVPTIPENINSQTTAEYFSAPSTQQTSPSFVQDQYQQQQQQHVAQPPPPPVARGALTNNGSSSMRMSSSTHDVDSLNQQMKRTSVHHGDLPPPPPRQRRDIQSSLFVGMDPSSSSNNGNNGMVQPLPPTYRSQDTTPMSSSVSPVGGVGMMSRQTTGTNSLQRQSTGILPLAQFTHPDLVFPGLNASIAEVVNATYKDNQFVKGSVVSELLFSYIVGSTDAKIPSSIKLLFPLAPNLGKLLVNNQFLRQIGETEFEIMDIPLIHLKTVGAVKYSTPIQSSVVSVLPVWRFEPHQASVVISVKLTPEILQQLPQDSTIILSHFIVSVSISGAKATSAATRPTGSFNKDKSRITWVYSNPVILGHDKEERIIARFATEGLARESEHGVQVKFTVNNNDGASLVTTPIELHGKNVYGIDPFSSSSVVAPNESFEDDWKVVPTVKTLIAGRYEGHS